MRCRFHLYTYSETHILVEMRCADAADAEAWPERFLEEGFFGTQIKRVVSHRIS